MRGGAGGWGGAGEEGGAVGKVLGGCFEVRREGGGEEGVGGSGKKEVGGTVWKSGRRTCLRIFYQELVCLCITAMFPSYL